MADFDGIRRLSPRQRQCLSMVASHIAPKDIAGQLGLSPHTVRSYLADCIRILEASDLRHAARIYSEASISAPQFLGGDNSSGFSELCSDSLEDPQLLRNQIWRLPLSPEAEADIASAAQIGVARPSLGDEKPTKTEPPLFHIFRGRRIENRLTFTQRSKWIMLTSIISLLMLLVSIISLDGILSIVKIMSK